MNPIEPFESVWTREIVQQIKSEFEVSNQSLLCDGSPTFKKLWPKYRNGIRELARASNLGEIGSQVLLFARNYRYLRLDFLNFELERLKR